MKVNFTLQESIASDFYSHLKCEFVLFYLNARAGAAHSDYKDRTEVEREESPGEVLPAAGTSRQFRLNQTALKISNCSVASQFAASVDLAMDARLLSHTNDARACVLYR